MEEKIDSLDKQILELCERVDYIAKKMTIDDLVLQEQIKQINHPFGEDGLDNIKEIWLNKGIATVDFGDTIKKYQYVDIKMLSEHKLELRIKPIEDTYEQNHSDKLVSIKTELLDWVGNNVCEVKEYKKNGFLEKFTSYSIDKNMLIKKVGELFGRKI